MICEIFINRAFSFLVIMHSFIAVWYEYSERAARGRFYIQQTPAPLKLNTICTTALT